MGLEKLFNVLNVTEERKELEIKIMVDQIAMPLTMNTLFNDSHTVLKDKPQVSHLHPSPGHKISKVTYLSTRWAHKHMWCHIWRMAFSYHPLYSLNQNSDRKIVLFFMVMRFLICLRMPEILWKYDFFSTRFILSQYLSTPPSASDHNLATEYSDT